MNRSSVRMKICGRWAVLLVLFLGSWNPFAAGAEDAAALFSAANRNYREGRYEQAAAAYESLVAEHPRVPVYRYNLGNAYYRLGKTGQAILAYENVLKIDPRNTDARSNLSYVRSLLEYRVQDNRGWYLQQAESWLNKVTLEESLFVVLAAWFIFLLVWIFVLFVRRGLPWGWFRKTLLVFSLLATAVYAGKYVQNDVIRDAIIVVPGAEVRSGPSLNDRIVLRLGEGLKVYVLDSRNDWSRILLVNGEGGWIRNAQLGEVCLR